MFCTAQKLAIWFKKNIRVIKFSCVKIYICTRKLRVRGVQMKVPSFRHSVIPSVIGACMLALSGCNQAPKVQVILEPTLEIISSQSTFRKGEKFDLNLEIYSPNDSSVNVVIAGSKNLGLDQEQMQVTIAAGQTQTLKVSGTPKRSGYYNITVNASGSQWKESAADILGFNVPTDELNIASAGAYAQSASGLESLETHLEHLPKLSDMQLYAAQVKAEFEGRDNVRGDFALENARFKQENGTLSEPQNLTVTYQLGTGGGIPATGELEGIRPAKGTVSVQSDRQLYCPSTPATVHIEIANGSYGVFPMKNIFVQVLDNNGIWPHKLMSQGYANSTGDYTYNLPTCDDDPGQNNAPDVYYVIQTRDVYGKFVNDSLGRYNAIASGTWWNDTATYHTFNFNAATDPSTQGFWVLRSAQFGADFNAAAGGIGNGQIPIKIYWPGSFTTATSAYSPVGRIVLGMALWNNTATIIHELGHNIKYYVGNQAGYLQCHASVYICDPMFAPDITQYTHSLSAATNRPTAVNEGFAHLLSEMTLFANGFDSSYTSYLRNCVNSCSFVGSGGEWEARIASFFYQYVTAYLANGQTNNYSSAFGVFRASLRDTVVFNQDFYGLWNSFAYRSFSGGSAVKSVPSFCPSGTASTGYGVFNCIRVASTLTEQALVQP
jgi:hypothetical protein